MGILHQIFDASNNNGGLVDSLLDGADAGNMTQLAAAILTILIAAWLTWRIRQTSHTATRFPSRGWMRLFIFSAVIGSVATAVIIANRGQSGRRTLHNPGTPTQLASTPDHAAEENIQDRWISGHVITRSPMPTSQTVMRCWC